VDEVVDRQGFAAGQPPPHGDQQIQSARVVRDAGAKGYFLQQQDRIEVGQLVAEQLPYPGRLTNSRRIPDCLDFNGIAGGGTSASRR
jgi:hypothetical protein